MPDHRRKNNPASLENPGAGPFNGDTVNIRRTAVHRQEPAPGMALRPPGARQEQRHSRDVDVRVGERRSRLQRRVDQISAPDTASGQTRASGADRLPRADQDQVSDRGVPEASKILGVNLGDSSMVFIPLLPETSAISRTAVPWKVRREFFRTRRRLHRISGH